MKFPSSQRFLMVYSGVLTLVFAGTVLMGATSGTRRATFDQITVHRINVVEPDGTLRMVISDAAQAPGYYFHGRHYPAPDRKVAGIIFYNDEGTENGGLIFGGRKDKNGKVSSFGHLSFDDYDQDQALVVQNSQDNTDDKATYVRILDRPDWDLEDLVKLQSRDRDLPAAEQHAAVEDFLRTHEHAATRLAFGTRPDKSSDVILLDPQGRKRIVMKVAADGKPVLQFLDADGKVIEQLPQASKP